MRLIDADALKEQFKDRSLEDFTHLHFIDAIDNAPTVDEREGEWERIDIWAGGNYVGGFIHKDCPMIKVSDHCLYSPWEYRYCPNCGKKMDSEPYREADNG